MGASKFPGAAQRCWASVGPTRNDIDFDSPFNPAYTVNLTRRQVRTAVRFAGSI